jgi:3-hydroxy-9,10-secoandrosta-1,3,5(10)-triene-9,17-dione monooxygenase reductase component
VSDPVEPIEAPVPIDAARYRQVLGHFPTGVTVVASVTDDDEPVGLAVGSFTSVSLDPPLVAFCPDKRSSSWPRIEQTGRFCVNILADDQEAVSRVFASKGGDKFKGLGWAPTGLGCPRLNDVLAWIDCTIEAVHEAGDHYIVVARVHELEIEREGGPLVFFRGGYGHFAP